MGCADTVGPFMLLLYELEARSIHLVHSQLETFMIFMSILTLHMYIILLVTYTCVSCWWLIRDTPAKAKILCEGPPSALC